MVHYQKIRFKTEESMRNSNINAIISTSSLEMGIDWDVINQIKYRNSKKYQQINPKDWKIKS